MNTGTLKIPFILSFLKSSACDEGCFPVLIWLGGILDKPIKQKYTDKITSVTTGSS